MSSWPSGTVATASWFQHHGVSPQLARKYRHSGWIEALGHGAFTKKGDQITWEGGLYAVQTHLCLPIHVGGKTAMQLRGYAHFLELGKESVCLFGKRKTKLPSWFRQYQWGVALHYTAPHLFTDSELGVEEHGVKDFFIKISSLERAIMEHLFLVPYHATYEISSLLIESLTSLRPQLVEALLEICCSIKVKRLFMVLAEKHLHTWVKKINVDKIDFGSGKRVLTPGGVLNKKYQITIPEER
jgi:hypothetical protein